MHLHALFHCDFRSVLKSLNFAEFSKVEPLFFASIAELDDRDDASKCLQYDALDVALWLHQSKPDQDPCQTGTTHLYILFDVNLQLADRDSSKLDADLVLSSDLVHGALITYTEFWCPWGICSGNHGIGIGEVLIQE